MPYLLGIDVGTSSTKALLTTVQGEVVGRGSAGYPILRPRPARAEQDPEAWWQATVTSVRQALSGAATSDPSVYAIALSGQMHGTVLLDRDGRPLAPAVIWPDQRSARQVAEITAAVGRERLVQVAGSPVASGFQAATIRWMQENEPELWRSTHVVLAPKDYVRYRMTQAIATDPSDGSGTLLLDVHQRDWSPELLDVLAISPDVMPVVQESLTIAGPLVDEAAQVLGLPAGVPVITGAADTACSMLGAGTTGPQTLLLTLSTGGQVVLPTREVVIDRLGRMHTFCGALAPESGGAGWYEMAAILAAGLSLRWLQERILAMDAEDAYDRMGHLAEEAPAGAGGLIFVPYLAGERTPHMDPLARGLFLGLTVSHGREHMVRAVMEGVALACYDAYQVLAELGAAPEEIVMAGGGARSPVWRQIVADVFNLPVRPLDGADQSARGAALLAGGGAGLFDPALQAVAQSTYGPLVEPSEARHALYVELYDIFRGLYGKHRDDFRRLRALDQVGGTDKLVGEV